MQWRGQEAAHRSTNLYLYRGMCSSWGVVKHCRGSQLLLLEEELCAHHIPSFLPPLLYSEMTGRTMDLWYQEQTSRPQLCHLATLYSLGELSTLSFAH